VRRIARPVAMAPLRLRMSAVYPYAPVLSHRERTAPPDGAARRP
jgi:hypothetical protein